MDAKRDDDALMRGVAQGEEAAFRLLVQRWEGQVLAFAIHMLGSREEAEDLVQDTFVKIFRNASGYRATGQFQAWLFRIAGNLARNKLRRRRIVRWISFDPATHQTADTGPSPEEALLAGQTVLQVQAALSRLPGRQRQALVLHRYQGMRYKEIAAAMNTSLAGVESLIQRGMVALRRDLSQDREVRSDAARQG